MFTKRFAQELMQLGRIDLSPEASLERIIALAAREVAGCAGAGALVWRGDQVIQSAVSHPDLGILLEYQYTEHDGPQWEARQTGDLVVVADTAATDRWPGYAAVALRHGVRSSLAFPVPDGGTVVTVGLYAVRPGVFNESAESMAALLTEQIAVAAGNTERYDPSAPRRRGRARAFPRPPRPRPEGDQNDRGCAAAPGRRWRVCAGPPGWTREGQVAAQREACAAA